GRPPARAARARPRGRAQPAARPRRGGRRAAAVPGAGADAGPDADRVAIDAVRSDDPDVSTGWAGDVRQRRGVTPALSRPYPPSTIKVVRHMGKVVTGARVSPAVCQTPLRQGDP